MIKKITIIGSGNTATQLGLAWYNANIEIVQILSRNKKSGENLAKKLNSQFIQNLCNLENVDLIVICVNDDNISEIAKSLPNVNIVHTSGNTSINILSNKKSYGVIYPVQSLNKDRKIDFKNIPICIEANSPALEKKIIDLSKQISNNVIILDSKQRKYLHLAAVIASNFSNYCYSIAKNILDNENINFNLLNPLIQHTAQKNLNEHPINNQTGPAKRGDKNTIKEHLSLLRDENYKKIYKLLSQNILEEHEH
tara:strand:- start:229 stop:987 length:759 start_codon:yes stop_codon:yes gene_type:complete